MELITARPTGSPARAATPHRGVLAVGLVQTRWHDDPAEHTATLSKGIAAASAGAEVVFLPELPLSRYPAATLPSRDLDRAQPLIPP
ncbi:hypothetical protein [Actinomadura nitritigenes]|uniref:hypothetical protein n=1 Tax=Actinomadura nitritigenes TaxID=134602 RepID=UPI003D8E9E9C